MHKCNVRTTYHQLSSLNDVAHFDKLTAEIFFTGGALLNWIVLRLCVVLSPACRGWIRWPWSYLKFVSLEADQQICWWYVHHSECADCEVYDAHWWLDWIFAHISISVLLWQYYCTSGNCQYIYSLIIYPTQLASLYMSRVLQYCIIIWSDWLLDGVWQNRFEKQMFSDCF